MRDRSFGFVVPMALRFHRVVCALRPPGEPGVGRSYVSFRGQRKCSNPSNSSERWP
jgi:hypothetical protein